MRPAGEATQPSLTLNAQPIVSPIGVALSSVSSGVSAYHGYKRNNSVGWAIGWGVLGFLFPIITPAIALAQGYGKPASRSSRRRRSR